MNEEKEVYEVVYKVDVDTRLSRMKLIHARWIIDLNDKPRNSKALIQHGFEASKITEALDSEKNFWKEDPFLHLI